MNVPNGAPYQGPGKLSGIKVGDRLVLVTDWKGGGRTAQEVIVAQVLNSTCRVEGEFSSINLKSGRVRYRADWNGVFRKEAYLPSAWGSRPYIRLNVDEVYKDNLRRALRWAIERADLSMLTRMGQAMGIKFDV